MSRYANSAPDQRRVARRRQPIAAHPPQDRAQDASAVHREAGDEVEERRAATLMNPSQPSSAATCGWSTTRSTPRSTSADQQARRRPGDRDQRLLARRAGVLVDRRRAAEDEQRDALDLQAEASRHERVRQLVGQHRAEEEERGRRRPRPSTALSVQPRNRRGNWNSASEYVTRKAMTSHDGWIARSMPASRPTFQPGPMRASLDQAGSGVSGPRRASSR